MSHQSNGDSCDLNDGHDSSRSFVDSLQNTSIALSEFEFESQSEFGTLINLGAVRSHILDPLTPDIVQSLLYNHDSIQKLSAIINTNNNHHIEDIAVQKEITVLNTLHSFLQHFDPIQQYIRSIQKALIQSRQEQESFQQRIKMLKLEELQYSMMFISQPPQDDHPIITQFKPAQAQWELNDKSMERSTAHPYSTILHNYCEHINSTPPLVFRYLIETKGFKIFTKNSYGYTPLHIAFVEFKPANSHNDNCRTSLTYLLSLEGIDFNQKDKNECTLLHRACRNIHSIPLNIFEYLIETKGSDMDSIDDQKNTPLHYAFRQFAIGDDVNILRYLTTRKDVNVNIKNRDHQTSLHFACQNINTLPLLVFKYLIEEMGMSINVKDGDGNTPLHDALYCFKPSSGGDITVLSYLLHQNGINVNHKDYCGFTLLHRACININSLPLDTFKYLIETKGSKVSVLDTYMNTPLHSALRHFEPSLGGDVATLMYLLCNEGVPANTRNQNGSTLLYVACDNINSFPLDIFKCLIEINGGDVHSKDRGIETPLHVALRKFNPNSGGDPEVLTYLFNCKAIDDDVKDQASTLLRLACQNINSLPLKVFHHLIQIGANIHAQDNKNNTPLHDALYHFQSDRGDVAILSYLLTQKGVDVHIKGNCSRTLLHSACININSLPLDIFKLLIEIKGSDLKARSSMDDTPLHYALRQFKPENGGDIAILIYLLNHTGVDVNLKGEYGSTLLHLACKLINIISLETFKSLIETNQGDINVQDLKKNTPLHIALLHFQPSGNFETLTYLLSRKDVIFNQKGEHGQTLTHLICLRVNSLPLDVFKCLDQAKNCGANIQDNSKNTPLHIAFLNFNPINNDVNILTYLLTLPDVNVNIKGECCQTLLHLACKLINSLPLDLFKYLIETKGANIHAVDEKKNNPLHIALHYFKPKKNGDIAALSYLFNHNGIDVRSQNQGGCTLLHRACQFINTIPLDVFKSLLETHGASSKVQDLTHNTPFHYALRQFNPNDANLNTLTYLIGNKRTYLGRKGPKGSTLLHSACENVKVLPLEIFHCLIETQNIPLDCDKNKNTPLHSLMIGIASKLDNDVSQIVYYFIQKGIKINFKNSDGLTALDLFSNYMLTHPITHQILAQNGAKLGKDC
jgi:ankyrin repeat protein